MIRALSTISTCPTRATSAAAPVAAQVVDSYSAQAGDDPAPTNYRQMLQWMAAPAEENRPLSETGAVRLPGLEKVWQAGFTGQGQTVAVIDSGIFPHADLRDQVVGWVDLHSGKAKMSDVRGHGTHVAGIVAGNGKKSEGKVQGVAPDAKLVGVRIETMEEAIAGVDWVVAHKDEFHIGVINISLGETPTLPASQDPWCQAVQRAVEAGLTVVVAAGNEGKQGPQSISTPGIAPNAITVGGVDDHGTPDPSDDTLYRRSSQGPTAFDHLVKPDVMAPAVSIYSTRSPGSQMDDPAFPHHGSDYVAMMGTSMATPAVAGLVALLKQARPDLSPADLKAILMQSVYHGPQNLPIVQADAALQLAQQWKSSQAA